MPAPNTNLTSIADPNADCQACCLAAVHSEPRHLALYYWRFNWAQETFQMHMHPEADTRLALHPSTIREP